MLPQPPASGPHAEYLTTLVRELEFSLRAVPAKSPVDNVLYLSSDQPVSLISPSGNVYKLTVDDAGNLETTAV